MGHANRLRSTMPAPLLATTQPIRATSPAMGFTDDLALAISHASSAGSFAPAPGRLPS